MVGAERFYFGDLRYVLVSARFEEVRGIVGGDALDLLKGLYHFLAAGRGDAQDLDPFFEMQIGSGGVEVDHKCALTHAGISIAISISPLPGKFDA